METIKLINLALREGSLRAHAGPEVVAFVREAVARHNVAVTRDTYYSLLANFLRGEGDGIVGGALGGGGRGRLATSWTAGRPADPPGPAPALRTRAGSGPLSSGSWRPGRRSARRR